MAKRLYEEEKIEAIAVKIRKLVPNWYKGTFTTAEMPAAVERVYEEGKTKGRTDGYNSGYGMGYTEGFTRGNKTGYDKGYAEGYSEANLNNTGGYDDGYHEGYQKGVAKGIDTVKIGEARTSNDITQQDDIVLVTSGYYAEDTQIELNLDKYYDQGYEAGFTAGAESVGSYEDGNEVAY